MAANVRGRIPGALNYAVLIIFSFICVYPLYYVIINSFSGADAIRAGAYLIPGEPTLLYYTNLLQVPDILNAVFISAARTVVGTALIVICSSFLAYMVTQRTLPHRKAIYRFVIITMYFNAGLIPWYMVMKDLGLKNNFLLYVLPYMISAFYVILVKTYIESLPPSLEESAALDGAGVVTTFIRIIMPLSMPIIACVTVFGAVWQWNQWVDNLYLVTSPKLTTLQYLLYGQLETNMSSVTGQLNTMGLGFLRGQAISPKGLQYAMTVISVLPILAVYPVMQKYFIKGIMLGAVKG